MHPYNKTVDVKTKTTSQMLAQVTALASSQKKGKVGPVKVSVRKGTNSMSGSSEPRAPKPAKTKVLVKSKNVKASALQIHDRNFMSQITSPRNQTPIQKFYGTLKQPKAPAQKLKLSDAKYNVKTKGSDSIQSAKSKKRSPQQSVPYSPNNYSVMSAKKPQLSILS